VIRWEIDAGSADTAIRGFHRLARVSTAAIDTKSGAASAKPRAGTRKSTVTLSYLSFPENQFRALPLSRGSEMSRGERCLVNNDAIGIAIACRASAGSVVFHSRR